MCLRKVKQKETTCNTGCLSSLLYTVVFSTHVRIPIQVQLYSIPPHVGRGVLAVSDSQSVIFAEVCGIWVNE